MTVKVITNNQYIYEANFFGAASTTHTIDVSTLQDAIAVNGVFQQRMDLKLCYSVKTGGYVKLELATDGSGTFAEYWRGYGNG